MKRIFAILFLIAILLSACTSDYKIAVGESMKNINQLYKAYININGLSAYQINEKYLVTIYEGDILHKLVEFSSERKCIRAQGINLIKNIDINQFLNTNFNILIEKFGQPHVDVGSGFYIPAYVTEDANLIYFELDDEVIIGVIKLDLFTNNVLERVGD